MKIFRTFLAVFILVQAVTLFGQTALYNKAEDELLRKDADKLFRRENYVAALPLYSQLLSLHPNKPEYNYKFGVCLLMADKRDIQKPLRYLESASKSEDIDVEVFYYLGLGYHYNYRFKDAINAYDRFLQKAPKRLLSKYDAKRQIEMCYNGIALLNEISDLYVLERHHVGTINFHRSYNLMDFGGRFLALPEELKTRVDKANNHNPLVFFNENVEYLYFSSYGFNRRTGKDIYRVRKRDNGLWEDPELLPDIVNTPYDEDYPYMMPDGVTLFFSSKGHNSMGGYDVFKTVFDTVTSTWSKPQNLDFAINTPFDDILFIADQSLESAYFASDRVADVGMINVYRVRIDARLDDDIKDLANALNLSQDDPAYKRALELLNKKTNLEVNATDKMFEKAIVADQVEVKTTEDVSPVVDEELIETNEDIIRIAQKQANDLRQEVQALKDKQNAAKTVSEGRSKRAMEVLHEAQKARRDAASISDPIEREDAIIKASNIQAEADKLKSEAEVAELVYNDLKNEVLKKEKELVSVNGYLVNIEKAIQAETPDKAMTILNNMLSEMSERPTATFTDKSIELILAEAEQKLPHARTEISEIRRKIENLSTQSSNLKKEADSESDSDVKSNLLRLAQQKDNEIAELTFELNQMIDAVGKEPEVEIAGIEPKLAFRSSNVVSSYSEGIGKQESQYNHLVKSAHETALKSNDAYVKAQQSISEAQRASDDKIMQQKYSQSQQFLMEAERYALESFAMNSAAQKLRTLIDDNNKQLSTLNVEMNRVNELINQKNFNEADRVLKDIEAKYQFSSIESVVDKEYQSEISKIIQNDEKEARTLLNESESLYNKYANNSKEILTLANKIDNTSDIQEKESIQRQITALERENMRILSEAEEAYKSGNAFSFKAARLRMELSVLTSNIPQETTKPDVAQSPVQINNNLHNLQTQLINDKAKVRPHIESSQVAQTQIPKPVEKEQYVEIKEEQVAVIEEKQIVVIVDTPRKEELIKQNSSIESNYDEHIKTIETRAARLYGFAVQKSNESKQGIEEADKIIQNARTIADANQRSREIEKANVLYEKSFNLAKEAIAASTLAKEIENNVESLKRNKQLLKSILSDTETMIVSGDLDRAEAALANLRNDWGKERIERNVENNILTANNQSLALKTQESNRLLQVSTKQYDEAKKLKSESDNFVRQAQNTNDPVKKRELLSEAAKLQNQSQERKVAADNNFNKGSQLEIEVGVLKMKVDFVISVQKTPERFTGPQVDNKQLVISDVNNLQNKIDNHDFSVKNENIVKSDIVLSDVLRKENISLDEIVDATQPSTFPVDDFQSPVTKSDKINEFEKQFQEYSLSASEERRLAETATTPDKRVEHLERANELEQNANNVKIGMFKAQGEANTTQFTDNKRVISQIRSNNHDEYAIRGRLLADEADYYFQRAMQRRREAAATDLKSLQANLLEDANRSELLALQKQHAAIVQFYNSKGQPDMALNYQTQDASQAAQQRRAAEQRAAEQRAAEQRAAEQRAAEQRAAEQRTAEQRTAEQRTAEQRAAEQRAAEQRAATQTTTARVPETALSAISVFENVDGILFTVQIGVFGAPRTPEQFFNLPSLFYDRLPNGFYRYFSGVYNSRNAAVAARALIVNRGIDDAFVVAFYNGNRVTVAEAVSLLESGGAKLQNKLAFSSQDALRVSPEPTIRTAEMSLYYSVQVGVYREQRSSDVLYNIDPLEYETIQNGLHRHLHGRFSSRQLAENAKNEAVNKGVDDAFVVAYHNGRRISLSDARRLEEDGTPVVRTSTQVTPTTTRTQVTQEDPAVITHQAYSKENIVFKIQIGAFRQPVAPHVLIQYKSVIGQDVEELRTSEGLTLYLVGDFKDFLQASALRNRIINAGIPDAFVVAYHNDERISVNIAREVLR